MADFAGTFYEHGPSVERLDDLEAIRTRYDFVAGSGGLVDSQVLYLGGSLANTQPVEQITTNWSGMVAGSFYDDFYNRIYLIPSSIDFGPIAAEATATLTIWNAYLSSATLEAIAIINGAGVEVDGPATPLSFKALQIRQYDVIASAEGSPTVAATIEFTLTTPKGDELLYLDVSGRRARLAPFKPNWAQPYEIAYAYKTEVITSRDGTEQRRALRTTARKMVNYTANPHGDALRAFNRLMASWHNYTLVIPEAPRKAVTFNALSAAGTSVLLADSAPDWLVGDRLVVLWHRGQAETRRTLSVAGNAVTFDGPGTMDFPAGSKIHPALTGLLAATISSKRLTNTVADAKIVLEVTPASEPPRVVSDAPHTFNGRELFKMRPNWATALDITNDSLREVVDFDRGRIGVYTPVDEPARIERFEYLGRNYAEAELLLDNFDRGKGQRGEFYMPTWEPDIDLYETVPFGERDLKIAGTDFFSEYNGSEVHRAVAVFMRNGDEFFRVVDAITTEQVEGVATNSVVAVTVPFPYALDPAAVKQICWLLVWRHASDTLTMVWRTDEIAECQFTLRTLKDV